MFINPETSTIFQEKKRILSDELELFLYETQKEDYQKQTPPTYVFQIKSRNNETLGMLRLRLTDDTNFLSYYGHIGYFIKTSARGHYYAAKALKMVLPLAQFHGINPLLITCNPNNQASIKTCQKAGAIYLKTITFGTSRSKQDGPAPVKKMVWELYCL